MEIINDVLDVSKIEAGRLELEVLPFSLRDTVDQVAALFATSAHERGLLLPLYVDHRVPDRNAGGRCAARPSSAQQPGVECPEVPEKGEISIVITRVPCVSGGRLRLRAEVRDSGIGVPRGAGARRFNPSPGRITPWPGASFRNRAGPVHRQATDRADGRRDRYITEPGRGSCFWSSSSSASIRSTAPPSGR